MANFYPVESIINGRLVSGTPFERNSQTMADKLNKISRAAGGADVVRVGKPVPSNPAYSKVKDPEGLMLAALLAVATESVTVPDAPVAELVKQG